MQVLKNHAAVLPPENLAKQMNWLWLLLKYHVLIHSETLCTVAVVQAVTLPFQGETGGLEFVCVCVYGSQCPYMVYKAENQGQSS